MTVDQVREKYYTLKAKEDGIEEGIRKTAVNLLKMGMANDIVAQGTGLSLEEVEKIKREIENQRYCILDDYEFVIKKNSQSFILYSILQGVKWTLYLYSICVIEAYLSRGPFLVFLTLSTLSCYVQTKVRNNSAYFIKQAVLIDLNKENLKKKEKEQ